MVAGAPIQPAAAGVTRRRLLKSGLALGGASLVMPGTAAYAAAQAATDLIVTDYRPAPPNWPAANRLTITVIADLHAGGPNMGIARVRVVVDAAQALNSDLIVILGDYFAPHRFITEHVPNEAWAAELGRLTRSAFKPKNQNGARGAPFCPQPSIDLSGTCFRSTPRVG